MTNDNRIRITNRDICVYLAFVALASTVVGAYFGDWTKGAAIGLVLGLAGVIVSWFEFWGHSEFSASEPSDARERSRGSDRSGNTGRSNGAPT